uniref:TAR DNA-binding protein 43 N-terminal domain-containing protein n=1 Tax=Meloidogyne incognita TaxID=6306 RepID=A0A914KUQ1_MELIC
MAATYIEVLDPNNGEPLRVNLSNGALLISSIDDAFRGVFGLKYLDVTDGAKYVVSTDPTNQVFLAPEGGWGNKIYELVHLPNRSASVAPDPVEHRPISPWQPKLGNKPLLEDVEKYCFYLKIDKFVTCVTRINKSYFATFRHLVHDKFELNNKNTIYSDDGTFFQATIVYINDHWDFILFKSDVEVNGDGPPISRSFDLGVGIILYGRGNDKSTLGPQSGKIYSVEDVYGQNGCLATFLVGTIKNSEGDSGGAVFDSRGLLAMNIGNTYFSDRPSSIAVNKAAYFNPFNYMVVARSILSVIDELEKPSCDKKENIQPTPIPSIIDKMFKSPPTKKTKHT